MAHTLLRGWWINASAMAQNGLPFNLGLNSSANTNGAGGSRTDRIGSGVLSSSDRSLFRWFDASAFAYLQNVATAFFPQKIHSRVSASPGKQTTKDLWRTRGYAPIELASNI